jgi:hypothetical protein
MEVNGKAMTSPTSRNELSKAAAEAAIEAHNRGCLESCGKTSSHQYVRDSRLCDERRDCPDCPKDWMIEYTIEAEDRLTPSEMGTTGFQKIGTLHRRRTGDVDFHQEADVIPLGIHEILDVYMKEGDIGS